jgi:hypothetical protein
VWLRLVDGRLQVLDAPTARDRALARVNERELVAEMKQREDEYAAACLAWHKRYLGHRARAYGYDEGSIARAQDCLSAMRPDGGYRVTQARIEIDLHAGVTAILRGPERPKPVSACPHYEAMPGMKRCRSYQDDGTCGRDDLMCVDWLVANRRVGDTR